MDFLTSAAYVGILLLVIVNALLVSRIQIKIRDDDQD